MSPLRKAIFSKHVYINYLQTLIRQIKTHLVLKKQDGFILISKKKYALYYNDFIL